MKFIYLMFFLFNFVTEKLRVIQNTNKRKYLIEIFFAEQLYLFLRIIRII